MAGDGVRRSPLVNDDTPLRTDTGAAGVDHVGNLARNDRGTPRLDSAFERVETVAQHPLWCLINGDIILLDDFLPAVKRVASAVGEGSMAVMLVHRYLAES